MARQPVPPILTRDEYREMLREAELVGPVRGPWGLIAGLLAVSFTVVGCVLLSVNSVMTFILSACLFASAMLLLQIVLHECAHGVMFRQRPFNTIAGWLIGLAVLTPFFSYRRGHTAHHHYAGTDRDPTAAPCDTTRHRRFIEVIVKLRLIPVLYLFGVYFPYLLYDLVPTSRQWKRTLLQYGSNLLVIVFLHGSLATFFGPTLYLGLLASSFWLSALFYEYLFTQHQHVGLIPVPRNSKRFRPREQQVFSRSVRIPFDSLLMFFNLHKEHHLFPHLPCGYLPRLHRWLQQNRPDVLQFTSDYLGMVKRRRDLKLYSPTVGDHD
ncbi:MAG: hypothetical protein GY903_14355 [Fuerstiella sp.]|nr:hypothetical protein [Fuerstiella sp.]MCP4855667.1 hypothetical protein [Fuerstiella sp.]